MPSRSKELFELALLGGAAERRYRRLRPDVEPLPWGTLDVGSFEPWKVEAARRAWTICAFQEHRSAAATAEALRATVTARAPLDLVAMASRFMLDEIAHVEMCARVAMELGGAAPILHDPHALIDRGGTEHSPLLEAAELVVRTYCVEESLSAPMLRGAWRASRVPLIRAVLGKLAKDEAGHGRFGWMFLDWASDRLSEDDRRHLAGVAREAIDAWVAAMPKQTPTSLPPNELAGLDSAEYRALAGRSLQRHVLGPLRERGIDPGTN